MGDSVTGFSYFRIAIVLQLVVNYQTIFGLLLFYLSKTINELLLLSFYYCETYNQAVGMALFLGHY